MIWAVVFNCPGQLVPIILSLALVPNTIWTKMPQFAQRSTIQAKLVWAISKNCVMVSRWLCQHWSMERISMLVVIELVLHLILKLKLRIVIASMPREISWVECNFKNKLRNSEVSKINMQSIVQSFVYYSA